MRVLIDTNVILDYLLDREPFSDAADAVWQAGEAGRLEAFISGITPVNVFYIARRLRGGVEAHNVVSALLSASQVCTLDSAILMDALELDFRDYEDAVQCASATASGLDAILTRDPRDYTSASLPVFSPEQFLSHLENSTL